MKVLKSVFFCAVITLFFVLSESKKMIVKDVKICQRDDPNLSECFAQNFRKLILLMSNGIPEMNIVPIEPIRANSIFLDFSDTQSVKLVANLSNAEVRGMSRLRLDKCKVTKLADRGLEMNLEMTIPHITLLSDYVADGRFLLLRINTHGNFSGEFSDLVVKGHWISDKFMKKGKQHLKFDNDQLDMKFGHLEIHFDNLFGNNVELNDRMDKTINENIDVLYDEIKPVILETIKSVSLNIVNSVYNLFPFDMLFPVN